MKNSRDIKARIAEYRKAGWEVISGVATQVTSPGKVSVGMAPDGEYDTWIPLPVDAAVPCPPGLLSSHDVKVQRTLKVNELIARGSFEDLPGYGDLPSAWVDYAGMERNKDIYARAKKAALLELRRAARQVPKKRGFKKSDLRNGMVIEYRGGNRAMVVGDKLLSMDGFMPLDRYTATMRLDVRGHARCDKHLDINKVYSSRGCCLTLATEESQLLWARRTAAPLPVKFKGSGVDVTVTLY